MNRATTDTTRSRTIAAWLAVLLGPLGIHRIYLYGWHDTLAWLFPLPTLLGLLGFLRMRSLGQDDVVGWLLVPLLGVMLTVAMLSAIVYALMPGDKWALRHGPAGAGPAPGPGIGAVLAAIVALLLGGAALVATIAFSAQKFFEWELSNPQAGIGSVQPLQSSRSTDCCATPGSSAASRPSRG